MDGSGVDEVGGGPGRRDVVVQSGCDSGSTDAQALQAAAQVQRDGQGKELFGGQVLELETSSATQYMHARMCCGVTAPDWCKSCNDYGGT